MNTNLFKDKDLTLNTVRNRDSNETFIVIKDSEETIEIENVNTAEKLTIAKNELLDAYEIIGW